MKAPKNNEKENKLRPHLLPLDLLMELLCPAYEEGLLKYFKESWRMGFLHSVMYDACQRHIKAFYFDKEEFDQETLKLYGIKKPHLGAAIFCLISMYITQKLHPHMDDRGMDMVAYEAHMEKMGLTHYDKARKEMEDIVNEKPVPVETIPTRNKVVASKLVGKLYNFMAKSKTVLWGFF